jgi:ABC-type proline/glycine betaine transport system substrate-binding protein
MKINKKITGLAFSLVLAGGAATAQTCELNRSVKLADGNWDAIQVFNSIAATILDKGYGCKTEFVTGGMVPLFTALGKGDVDIFMDVWISNNQEIWDKTMTAGAVNLGVMYPDATEGWYVPRYVVEGDEDRGIKAVAPDLKSVEDLAKYKGLFEDPEQPGMGRFLNCPIGWGCEQKNNTKIDKYGLSEAFVNFKPGSGAALDSAFASANKRGKPIVGYYWEPTWLLGVHDMIKLSEPACTDSNADACAFPKTVSSVTASAQFVEQTRVLENFFSKLTTSSAEISAALAYLQNNEGSDREDAALNFLKTREDTWAAWVTPEAAEKIKAGL